MAELIQFPHDRVQGRRLCMETRIYKFQPAAAVLPAPTATPLVFAPLAVLASAWAIGFLAGVTALSTVRI